MTILVRPTLTPPGPLEFPTLGNGGLPSVPRTGLGRLSLYLSLQINFLIFIRILGILVSKLRTRQMRCPDYRLR